jgi:anti-anti-sigma factor
MNTIVKAFQPSGILDSIRGNQLRREITSAVETGVDIVLIDLQDITFMNSAGLGTLLAALRMVRTTGGRIFICSVSEPVKMVFEITKMERVVQVFNSRDEFNSAILSPECMFFEHN